MNYLEYLAQQWNAMLAQKVEEQQASGGSIGSSGNSGSSGSSGSSSTSALDELEKYIKDQYANAGQSKPTLPDVPEYEKMDMDFASDGEIRQNAESALSDYANQAKNAIEDEIAALEKKYSTQKDNAKTGYDSQDNNLQEIYGEAKESVSNDMLKRGLARSSILANTATGLEKELASKRSDALRAYTETIGTLESEITSLEGKRQKALNDFNIAYAAKLTEQINKLTEKRDEQYTEALKYNNSITEKEYGQTTQKQLDESDLYTEELNQAQKEKDLGVLTSTQQKEIYVNTYNKMDGLLSSMSKSDAKKLFESSGLFRQYLSDYYYYKLYDKYGR